MEITLFRRARPHEVAEDSPSELCEDDLRHLVELERGQRLLLQSAYEETVAALARALEFKDTGTGAPDRLAGEEIPLSARIFAVADALDAMTNDRPYRGAGTWSHAAEQIGAGAKRQFDPDVVEAFRARELDLLRLHRELDD